MTDEQAKEIVEDVKREEIIGKIYENPQLLSKK